VVRVEVVLVVIQVHVERGESMSARFGDVVDLGVTADTVGARAHVADIHVVNAERVRPLRRFAFDGRAR